MSEYVDNFESLIPLEMLDILLDLGKEFSFDPTSSIESEEYFKNLIDKYNGDTSKINEWLREKIITEFQCVDKRPIWIQNPSWQFANNKPMLFVGQLDCSSNQTRLHDDATFYVFWDRNTGETKAIIQVS